MDESSQLTIYGTKRRRLMQACLVCRRKKTKCDGVKPNCGNCNRLNQTCSYGPLHRKRASRQKHIHILEERLQQMEKLLKPSTGQPHSHSSKQQQQQPPSPLNNTSSVSGPSFKRTQPTTLDDASRGRAGNRMILPPIHVGQCLTTTRNRYKVIDMDRNLLPPRNTMERLVRKYLKGNYGVSPFFNDDDLGQLDACPTIVLLAIAAATEKYSDDLVNKEQPLWLCGEKYAEKIRQRISDILDIPSIPHVQVMMLLVMHEFGCGRGNRTWMYGGIAGRMVLELGLHKEPTHLLKDGEVMSVETWKKNELRRNVFWCMYIFDRFGGAACQRPVLFHDSDISCHLPCQDDCLQQSTFYSESLNGTQLVCYKVVERDGNGAAKSIKLMETTSQYPRTRSRCNLGWPTHMIRIISLFAKVATFVNRTVARSSSPLAPYDMECGDYHTLSEEIDLWCDQLPFNMRNTPANLQRYRAEQSRDTQRFILSHILQNSLVVFMDRPSLTLINTIKTMENITAHSRESIQLGVEKCKAASDNVSIMLTDINLHVKRVFPFISYLTYSTASVVVYTIFNGSQAEAKKAGEALMAHYQFLQSMRKYYVMADKFFFRLHEFYDRHKHQLHLRDGRRHGGNAVENTVDGSNSNQTSSSNDITRSDTIGGRDSYGSDTLESTSTSTSLVSTSPSDSIQDLNDLVGSLDDTFNQLLDHQFQIQSQQPQSLEPLQQQSVLLDGHGRVSTSMGWPLQPESTGMISTTTSSTDWDLYSIWPFPSMDGILNSNGSDRLT
ncbi:fungal-specific transcription factor domain-domain-containing protein [Absidia repens]|uniref:Fungal-specific transcription factor domain-domain-containing protein n=1 Tax=Absidia repens TaxID=90262 RepID=A0A1X2IE52_9FUNG|nr:fungal-specific transcription factor domain-domain-containing protein [Absidia repens]